VQLRSVDAAANTSSWTPSVPDAGSTVRLDRTPPTAPGGTGGSLTWQNVAQVSLNAGGASDLLSGIASYEYRTSTDGGGTRTPAAAGSFGAPSAEGATLAP